MYSFSRTRMKEDKVSTGQTGNYISPYIQNHTLPSDSRRTYQSCNPFYYRYHIMSPRLISEHFVSCTTTKTTFQAADQSLPPILATTTRLHVRQPSRHPFPAAKDLNVPRLLSSAWYAIVRISSCCRCRDTRHIGSRHMDVQVIQLCM